ncbi:L-lactate permease [Wohlfahrtiimonas chitiniclastica]|nr:L-lactate permease [Wohlfahrtiimonas chitiniclastica]
MTWMQNYTPIMNLGVSSLFAVLPIVTFFLCLTVFKIKGYLAGLLTLSMAILVAIFVYDMPVTMAFAASGYGFVYGLWPIAWIIITAVFLYKIAVKTGQFDIIRSSIISITEDQRLQLLLVGFAFGAFLEGRQVLVHRLPLQQHCWWV